MGFNELMHPRNVYRKSPPDFKILAETFEYFRAFVKESSSGHCTLNFKDPSALRALTYALLEKDFGLNLSIPLDRLIPTVPLRLNYVLWIEDLLSCLPEVFRHVTVRGFDVGTGASCIYPLLGAKLNGWHFLATEVDELSVSFAEKNVKGNGLESKIKGISTVWNDTNNCYISFKFAFLCLSIPSPPFQCVNRNKQLIAVKIRTILGKGDLISQRTNHVNTTTRYFILYNNPLLSWYYYMFDAMKCPTTGAVRLRVSTIWPPCGPSTFIRIQSLSEFEASHGSARSEKRPQPTGVCTGAQTETVTGGGEVEFVKEIIKDSLILKEQISWYTSMLGKKSSLAPVLAYLRDNNVKTITTTEFCQGQTMRWGVAWSHLPDVTVQESPCKRRKRAKKSKPLQIVVPDHFLTSQARTDKQMERVANKVTAMANYVKSTLEKLKVDMKTEDEVDESKTRVVFRCNASEKTWANQRRKRREKLRHSTLHESVHRSRNDTDRQQEGEESI
ncbi:PREDICTED: methyltransferase-like protein 16, partial [Acropora digitifera]|uniref:methyltransferase-like protein 16 n=1 Tax=Acropora digitifera TaxID=70779 RepID=UPI00077A6F90